MKTTPYTKPTDSYNYIHYLSCQSRACKNAIPIRQFLPLRRIYSDEEDFVAEGKIMAYHFNKAGYPDKLIQDSFDKAFQSNRNPLLIPNQTLQFNNMEDDKLFLMTTRHPTFRGVNDIVTVANWGVVTS